MPDRIALLVTTVIVKIVEYRQNVPQFTPRIVKIINNVIFAHFINNKLK